MTPSSDALDLDAYFARIGRSFAPRNDLATLDALVCAHVRAIPFENLDILLGRPIRLDLASLVQKLVRDRRGGYCFEQNTLFSYVLRALGFRLRTLAARVRPTPGVVLPRTHMLLEVDVAGAPYLADVGFGGHGPTGALRMEPGLEQRGRLEAHRFVREGDALVLQARLGDAWADLYAFGREEYLPVDYEMANHWTSTHPSSRFTRELVAVRADEAGRWSLRDDELSFRSASGEVERRSVGEGDERLRVLEERFGLVFPKGTTFSRRG